MTDDDVPGLWTRMRTWAAPPARLSRGWLVGGVLIAFFFIGLSTYAAVQQVRLDNRLTRELVEASVRLQADSCQADNLRISKARDVAMADVEADRAIWTAIAATADEAGRPLPEALSTTIFASLDSREANIDDTYQPVDCSPGETAAAEVSGFSCIARVTSDTGVTCSP